MAGQTECLPTKIQGVQQEFRGKVFPDADTRKSLGPPGLELRSKTACTELGIPSAEVGIQTARAGEGLRTSLCSRN